MLKNLTKSSLWWVVGFLEGEGAFQDNKGYGVIVRASQVNREPLLKLKHLIGGSIVLSNKAKGNKQTCWQWGLYGWEAATFLTLLLPYMSSKRRKQIKQAFKRGNRRLGREA